MRPSIRVNHLRHTGRKGLLVSVALLLSVCGSARAAATDDFEASPALNPYQTQERGYACTIETSPAGGSGKAMKIAWQETHQTLFEPYYSKDIDLPGSAGSPTGKVSLRVYADTGTGVQAISLRIKDEGGEIFQFLNHVKLTPGQWTDVSIPISQDTIKGAWGGDKTGKLQGELFLAGYAITVANDAPAGSVWVDDVTWTPAIAGASSDEPKPAVVPATQKAAVAPIRGSQLLGKYKLADAHLDAPPWRSNTIYGESLLFIRDSADAPATATLESPAAEIRSVRNAQNGTIYEVDKDFTLDAAHQQLTLTKDSRIASLLKSDLYKKPGEPHAIKFKAGDPNTWVMYWEYGFQPKQVEVDYVRASAWAGYTPQTATESLSPLIEKLKAAKGVRIVVLGDSISSGANATFKAGPPYMPPYPILVSAQLENLYGGTVDVVRLAIAGTTSEGGIKRIDEAAAAKPDLVIIAFGMNDVASRKPATYAANVKKMIDALRAADPNVCFILVSSILANPEWSWSPADQFPAYRDALAPLVGDHVALADMTTLWTDLLKHKRYYDLTGNGINHPNDYGHRLMAQVILSLLTNPTDSSK